MSGEIEVMLLAGRIWLMLMMTVGMVLMTMLNNFAFAIADDADAGADVDTDCADDVSPAIFGPLSAPIWLQVCASICSGLLSVLPSFCNTSSH